MKLIADPEGSIWVRDFIPEPDNFDWDEGNESKNAKHGVFWEEIESIFYREKYMFIGRIIEPLHNEWRGLILGESAQGRRLALIFTRRGDRLRPISCRPMRQPERRLYETSIQEYS